MFHVNPLYRELVHGVHGLADIQALVSRRPSQICSSFERRCYAIETLISSSTQRNEKGKFERTRFLWTCGGATWMMLLLESIVSIAPFRIKASAESKPICDFKKNQACCDLD
jgi:hypothetical protein